MESRPAVLRVCARIVKSALAAFALAALMMGAHLAAAENEAGNPFQVPATGTEDELLNFIVRVRKTPAAATDRPTLDAHQKKVQVAVLTASETLLAQKQDEARRLWTVRAKGLALANLARLGDATAAQKLTAYAAELVKDENPKVAEEGQLMQFQARATGVSRLAPQAQEQLVRDIDVFFGTIKVDQTHYTLATGVCTTLEKVNPPLSGMAYEELMAHFFNSADATIADNARKLAGAAMRHRMVGRSICITGNTIGGKRFDSRRLRGKVVVVEFWASWCGNCVKEIHNVKRVHDRYHTRGVEIVGITLDDDSQKAQQFADAKQLPWTNVISSDPKRRGWDDPTVVQLGIDALPTVIVMDQKGKVVSADAQGEKLDQLVASLLDNQSSVATVE